MPNYTQYILHSYMWPAPYKTVSLVATAERKEGYCGILSTT